MKQSQLLLTVFLLLGSSMQILSNAVPQKVPLYIVILAGGNGERLWPLSRQDRPKQLLFMGEKTLLEHAIDRAALVVPPDHIWVSTAVHHKAAIEQVVEDKIGGLILEPSSRNTAPAILLSCLTIYERDPHAHIIFVPADPFIPTHEYTRYAGFLDHAIDFISRNNALLLLGLKPTYPATGYGYIEFDTTQSDNGNAPFKVTHFHEKPSLAVAQRYIESGNNLWNMCTFCGHVSVFIEEFKQLAPDMFEAMVAYRNGNDSYESIPADSIDYALMEKSKNIWVLPVDFAWCDIGNIEVFLSHEQIDRELPIITIDAHNNKVSAPDKLVAVVGVDNLCIVQTDDALLIAKNDQAERVKDVVQYLKRNEYHEYL